MNGSAGAFFFGGPGGRTEGGGAALGAVCLARYAASSTEGSLGVA